MLHAWYSWHVWHACTLCTLGEWLHHCCIDRANARGCAGRRLSYGVQFVVCDLQFAICRLKLVGWLVGRLVALHLHMHHADAVVHLFLVFSSLLFVQSSRTWLDHKWLPLCQRILHCLCLSFVACCLLPAACCHGRLAAADTVVSGCHHVTIYADASTGSSYPPSVHGCSFVVRGSWFVVRGSSFINSSFMRPCESTVRGSR